MQHKKATWETYCTFNLSRNFLKMFQGVSNFPKVSIVAFNKNRTQQDHRTFGLCLWKNWNWKTLKLQPIFRHDACKVEINIKGYEAIKWPKLILTTWKVIKTSLKTINIAKSLTDVSTEQLEWWIIKHTFFNKFPPTDNVLKYYVTTRNMQLFVHK